MEWKREFEIGVEPIDAQHRELFERVSALLAAVTAGRNDAVGPAVQYLRRYALDHFSAEQSLMARTGYPKADAHAREHAAFASEVLTLEAQHAADPRSPWLASKLGVMLAAWLREHVLSWDRELGRYLREQGAPGGVGPPGVEPGGRSRGRAF